jgi:hypothetical protein
MSKWANTVLVANVVLIVLVFIAVVHAQRPPDLDSTGAAYLRVNINPTEIPPMVNINPNNQIPVVDINHMPEIHFPSTGCQNGQNYLTGIGRTVPGPLMVTYLQLPPQANTITLDDVGGSHSMNLNQAGKIATAIYLHAGQSLSFDADVMYSGCRPE